MWELWLWFGGICALIIVFDNLTRRLNQARCEAEGLHEQLHDLRRALERSGISEKELNWDHTEILERMQRRTWENRRR